ncbi:MAG: diguanylate cyclase [Deltaproteobacteria bacterium]|nr:diguanylate cyclase [Deltaproteobacteria bacterium]
MTQESLDERLVWLLQVSRSMLATRDLDRLLMLITDAFIELTEAERGFLLLKDRDSGNLIQRVGRMKNGVNISEQETRISTVATRVFKENKPVFATDTSAQNDLATRRSIHELRLKMMVCVPLASENEPLGVIYADGKSTLDKVFTHTNRRTIEMLAEHATAAIENARMFERATNDPLTGLPNSSHFLLQLAKVMREATPDQPAGVILLDVDAFKRVNLSAGAEMGDRALVDISITLQDVLRADGLIARYGSDKFAVLLPPDDSAPIAIRLRDVAERARAAIATKNYHGVQMSASIGGISFTGTGAESAPDLVAAADDALAKARARGQGHVEIF